MRDRAPHCHPRVRRSAFLPSSGFERGSLPSPRVELRVPLSSQVEQAHSRRPITQEHIVIFLFSSSFASSFLFWGVKEKPRFVFFINRIILRKKTLVNAPRFPV